MPEPTDLNTVLAELHRAIEYREAKQFDSRVTDSLRTMADSITTFLGATTPEEFASAREGTLSKIQFAHTTCSNNVSSLNTRLRQAEEIQQLKDAREGLQSCLKVLKHCQSNIDTPRLEASQNASTEEKVEEDDLVLVEDVKMEL